MMIIISKELSI